MDIDGVVGLSEETRRLADDLRFRHRQVLEILRGAGEPVPVEVLGMVRVADQLVAGAADLFRRAELFRDAESMVLGRTSLSMILHAWAGYEIDPSDPDVEPLSVAELAVRIDALAEAGVDPQQVIELQIMVAMVRSTEMAAQRGSLQRQLEQLSVLPGWGWVTEQRLRLESQITATLIEELGQEKLIMDLESGSACGPGFDLDRYREVEVQIAFLEWQLARRQLSAGIGRLDEILGTIGDAGLHDQMTFVERVAGDLVANESALPAALMLLAGMDEIRQTAVMAQIAGNGDLDALLAAVDKLAEESLELQHSRWGPVGDFVGGVVDSVRGSVTGVWGLTLQGLYDQEGWRERWSGVGDSAQLLLESPGDFLHQITDIETLRENPARWLGGIAPDIAGAVLTGGTVTAAARSGRFGSTLARIADTVDNLAVRVGARLEQAITDPNLRRMVRRLSDETGAIGIPDLSIGISGAQFEDLADLAGWAIRKLDGMPMVHGSPVSGSAGVSSDIDIAILVDEEEFNRLLDESFGTPTPGSAREITRRHADLTAKIESGDAGFLAVRRSIEALLGYDADISIVGRGGPFDQGPYFLLGEAE
jgi:hypothetical protein